MPYGIDDDDWPWFKRMLQDYKAGRFGKRPKTEERPRIGGRPKPQIGLLVTDLTHETPGWAAILKQGSTSAAFVTLLGDPTGGNFTLSTGPGTTETAEIDIDADADTLKKALAGAGLKVSSVSFGGSATYTLGGVQTAVTPRRWLIQFAGDDPGLVVATDGLSGEAAAAVQPTPLTLDGSLRFRETVLLLPHEPTYRPIRAGSIVTTIRSSRGDVVVSAEPRDWPEN